MDQNQVVQHNYFIRVFIIDMMVIMIIDMIINNCLIMDMVKIVIMKYLHFIMGNHHLIMDNPLLIMDNHHLIMEYLPIKVLLIMVEDIMQDSKLVTIIRVDNSILEHQEPNIFYQSLMHIFKQMEIRDLKYQTKFQHLDQPIFHRYWQYHIHSNHLISI